jgi:hypothetical protein
MFILMENEALMLMQFEMRNWICYTCVYLKYTYESLSLIFFFQIILNDTSFVKNFIIINFKHQNWNPKLNASHFATIILYIP